MDRSYLFAPGHNPRLLAKVFDAGADAVMLDLEDAVPPEAKDAARRAVAEVPRSLGFFGKSAIHPRQLPILHEAFTPTAEEITWAREVIAAFDAAGGEALRLPSGEFVDLPVADRAHRLLHLTGSSR